MSLGEHITSFGKLFRQDKGLADLTEEPSEVGEQAKHEESLDILNWDDTAPDYSPPLSVSDEVESVIEYETIPVVGGGTITQPSIYRSQSMIQPLTEISSVVSGASPPTYFGQLSRKGAALPERLHT